MSSQFKFKISEQIRRGWHGIYYTFAKDKGLKFALTCKEAAEHVDLGRSPKMMGRLRYFLHMSLCQGCRNYAKTASVLRTAVKSILKTTQPSERLNNLNSSLLAKFKKPKF